jgi:hypothetical protein
LIWRISQGTTLEEFRKNFDQIVARAGWSYKATGESRLDYTPGKDRERILGDMLGRLPEALRKQVQEGENKRSGSPGGYWPVIGEKKDQKAIRQINNVACGAAAVVMLLKDRNIDDIDQERIIELAGAPTTIGILANVLSQIAPLQDNGSWIGQTYSGNDERIWALFNQSGAWIANFQQPGSIGHIVVIDGRDKRNRVKIRDPWEGTSYKMEWEEFLNVWTRGGVFWQKP